jgi:hypothetical protein
MYKIDEKTLVFCLRKCKIRKPKTYLEQEYNDYLVDRIFDVQMKRFYNLTKTK